MTTPLISIVVPVYNVETYLCRCLNSLINQTCRDIEIILVDDGSPDYCPSICDDYALKDNRIKVIHKTNGGLGYARNNGIEIAKGEYIAFVDSDDFVSLEMYEKLYDAAKKYNCDAVFCGMNTELRNGKWKESKEVYEEQYWQQEELKAFMLDMVASAPYIRSERRYSMSVWHAIYRRSLIEENEIRFESERVVVSEDIPYQVDFLSVARTIAYLPNAYYYHCLNGASLSSVFKREKFVRFKELRKKLQKRLSKVEGAYERIDRLFIGYTRSYLVSLINAKTNDKIHVLKEVIADDVWKELKREYPSQWLPLYSKIHYNLLLSKHTRLLLVYSFVLNILKQR